MTRSRLVMALAATFGAMAVSLAVFAVLLEPFALLVAVPFAVVAYLFWYQASGRLVRRVYASVERRARVDERARAAGRRATETDGGRGGFGAGPRTVGGRAGRERARADDRRRRRERWERRRAPQTDSGPSRAEAYGILGLDPSADRAAVKRAYRERVKETHPDRGGSKEAFKRVTAAYERLTE